MERYTIQINKNYEISEIKDAVYPDIINTKVWEDRSLPNKVLIVKSNNLKKQIDIMSVLFSEKEIKSILEISKIEGIMLI